MRALVILLVLMASLCCLSCDASLWVEVTIGDEHPWERASERKFWYTIVCFNKEGITRQQLSIGKRSFRIPLTPGQTTILAVYPLGSTAPLGGAYHPGSDIPSVQLTYDKGPLAHHLLHIATQWPKPIATCDFGYLYCEIRSIDVHGTAIDWGLLAEDLVSGELSSDSFAPSETKDVILSELLPGWWIPESPLYPKFYAFSFADTAVEALTPGVHRYLNVAHGVELRIVVPDDPNAAAFWHVVPMDPLLQLSEDAYLQLLLGI